MDASECQDNVGFLTPQLEEILKILMNENDRIMYECQTRERNIREGREEGMKIGLEQGREEGMALGLAEGREEGRAEGRRAAMIEMAKALLETGMSKDQIMSITGLDEAEMP